MIWNDYCKDCKSFCVYRKRFWCKLKNIAVMPFSQACKKYKRDNPVEELVDNDEYVQDLMFGRL